MGNTLTSSAKEKGLKSKGLLTLVLYIMMLAYAFSMTLTGPLIIVFVKQYDLALSDNGLITLFQGLGGIIFVFFGIFLAEKFPRPTLIKVTFGVYCSALILLFFALRYILLLLLFFAIGASTRMLEAVVNAYICDIHREKRPIYLNITHAFFGIGALAGPLLSSYFVDNGFQTNLVFLTLAIFCTIIYAAYLYIQRNVQYERSVERKSIGTVIKMLRNRNILIFFFLAFTYVGFAMGASTWIPSYVTSLFNPGAGVSLSGFVVSALWLGVTIGRLITSHLISKLKIKPLVFYSNIVSGIILVATWSINTPLVYILGFFISGFFTGAVIPLTIAMAGEMLPQNIGSVSSVITLGGTFGLMVIPWLTGIIADGITFNTAILALSCLPFILSLLSILIKQKKAT